MTQANGPHKTERLPTIAILSSERYPHHDTNTQQIVKNASALHHAGLSVSLWVPPQAPFLGKGKERLMRAIRDYYHIPAGLPIRVIPNVPASDLRLEKFFHSLVSTLLAVADRRVDLVYTRNRFIALLAWGLGQPFIFETYRKLGDEHPRILRFLGRRTVHPAFVGLVTHSQVAADSMRKAGIPAEKILVLHNGVDVADMRPVLSKAAARDLLGLSRTAQVVTYTGNMQPNKCVETLIDIAAYLPETIFLLVGGTPAEVERLRAYAEVRSVRNILLPGRQPIAAVSSYLYAADVLAIPPAAAPLETFGKTVLPFKLFPYLAAGRPIAAPDQADMRELLSDGRNALLLETDRPERNAARIKTLLADPASLEALGAAALATSEGLTWESRALRFKTWLSRQWEHPTG
jgi:glycosyltransferase involved in cell wall biosynthesis